MWNIKYRFTFLVSPWYVRCCSYLSPRFLRVIQTFVFHDSVVVVVQPPAVDPPTDFRQAQEQILIQEFVMKLAGRRLDTIIFPRVSLAMNRVLISASWSQQRTVFDTNAGRIPPAFRHEPKYVCQVISSCLRTSRTLVPLPRSTSA